MNKAELIDTIEARLGSKKAASDALEAVVDAIIREVAKGNKVSITGFGTFEKATRAARTGRNPRTGDLVPIEQTAVPKFKAGTGFKAVVADPGLLPKTGNAGARATAATRGARAATPIRRTTGKGAAARPAAKAGGAKSATKAAKR